MARSQTKTKPITNGTNGNGAANNGERLRFVVGKPIVDTPDHMRPLEFVLGDHANRAWGEIRDIFPLDRVRGEKALVEAMRNLLDSVRDDTSPLKEKVKTLEQFGSQLLGIIVKLASRMPQAGDPPHDNRRRCRSCNEPMTKHDSLCKVEEVIKAGRAMGMVVADG
jgi:hypothetical protein